MNNVFIFAFAQLFLDTCECSFFVGVDDKYSEFSDLLLSSKMQEGKDSSQSSDFFRTFFAGIIGRFPKNLLLFDDIISNFVQTIRSLFEPLKEIWENTFVVIKFHRKYIYIYTGLQTCILSNSVSYFHNESKFFSSVFRNKWIYITT